MPTKDKNNGSKYLPVHNFKDQEEGCTQTKMETT